MKTMLGRDVEQWLRSQSKANAEVIAARTALRILPLIVDPHLVQVLGPNTRAIRKAQFAVLGSLRLMSLVLTTVRQPRFAAQLKSAVQEQSEEVYLLAEEVEFRDFDGWTSVLRTFANAGQTIYRHDYYRDAKRTLDRAEMAELDAGGYIDGHSSLVREATYDAELLDAGMATAELANSPLWITSVAPGWLGGDFGLEGLGVAYVGSDGDVWDRWYKEVLTGVRRKYSDVLDRYRCTIPSAEWVPDFANKLIKSKEVELSKIFSRESGDTDEIDVSQRSAAYSFDIHQGQIVAKATLGATLDILIAEDIRQSLILKFDEAASRLAQTQSPRRYIESAKRAAGLLAKSPADQLPLGQLIMVARSLETDLAALLSPEGRAEFPADLIAHVEDAVKSLDDFKALFPGILKIESARMALRLATGDAEFVNAEIERIQDEVTASAIVDSSAVAALASARFDIKKQTEIIKSSIVDDEVAKAIEVRAELVASRLMTVRNFVARALGGIAQRTMGSIGRGFDSAIESATEATVKAGLAYLVGSIAGPLVGLAVFVASFGPFARKAQNLQDDNIRGEETEDV